MGMLGSDYLAGLQGAQQATQLDPLHQLGAALGSGVSSLATNMAGEALMGERMRQQEAQQQLQMGNVPVDSLPDGLSDLVEKLPHITPPHSQKPFVNLPMLQKMHEMELGNQPLGDLFGEGQLPPGLPPHLTLNHVKQAQGVMNFMTALKMAGIRQQYQQDRLNAYKDRTGLMQEGMGLKEQKVAYQDLTKKEQVLGVVNAGSYTPAGAKAPISLTNRTDAENFIRQMGQDPSADEFKTVLDKKDAAGWMTHKTDSWYNPFGFGGGTPNALPASELPNLRTSLPPKGAFVPFAPAAPTRTTSGGQPGFKEGDVSPTGQFIVKRVNGALAWVKKP